MAQEGKPTLLTRIQGVGASISKFFREVRAEFRRVQWPGRRELVSLTVAVLAYVALITAFLGIVDLGLSSVINSLIKIGA